MGEHATRRFFLFLLSTGAGLAVSRASAHGCSDHDARQRAEFRAMFEKAAEQQVRDVVASWYAEVVKGRQGRQWRLFAPGAIIEDCRPPRDDNKQLPRVITELEFPRELAANALKFDYEITRMLVEPNLARVDVWERGWFYAWAVESTYEDAAGTTFILQRDDEGAWKIAAYGSRSSAVHPDHVDDPMPDLREEYYRRFPPSAPGEGGN